jgi:hypothetical protein
MSSKEYTEDEVKTAVAVAVEEATAALRNELNAIKESEEAAAVDARVAEAVAAKDAEIADLQGKLDTVTLEAEEAKKTHDELVAFLETEAAAKAQAEVEEARRNDRIEAVKEFAFSEDYVAAAIDRWVAMEDEAFTALLDDWKAVSTAKKTEAPKPTTLPSETAMTASREETTDSVSARREVLGLRFRGVDTRKL